MTGTGTTCNSARDTLVHVNAQLCERECDALDQLLTLVDACDTANDTCHTEHVSPMNE